MSAALLLAACDRQDTDPSQAQQSPGAGAVTGEIDRSQAGSLLPDILLDAPDGSQLNLAAAGGEPVLVNLWATWCAPCIKEMPLLNELAQDYDGRVRVLTVSQDFQGAEAVEPFFAQRDLPALPQWLDTQNRLMDALSVTDLPTTVLYDAEGREVWRIAGDYDWSSVEARGLLDEAVE